jgi:hypothetical protein
LRKGHLCRVAFSFSCSSESITGLIFFLPFVSGQQIP